MVVADIIKLLDAKVISQDIDMNHPVKTVCGSDMMSDVLAFVKQDAVLLTGLNNLQVLRTAEMMDIVCIVFVRGKTPSPEMIEMADELNIYLLGTQYTMFDTCGILYEAGLRGGRKVNE
ncbi:MAG: hypothetical protein K6F37_06825 [Lachnospiraceae bacterium]|nr:hypothetical protein [Lachnospiraceae bacterium]